MSNWVKNIWEGGGSASCLQNPDEWHVNVSHFAFLIVHSDRRPSHSFFQFPTDTTFPWSTNTGFSPQRVVLNDDSSPASSVHMHASILDSSIANWVANQCTSERWHCHGMPILGQNFHRLLLLCVPKCIWWMYRKRSRFGSTRGQWLCQSEKSMLWRMCGGTNCTTDMGNAQHCLIRRSKEMYCNVSVLQVLWTTKLCCWSRWVDRSFSFRNVCWKKWKCGAGAGMSGTAVPVPLERSLYCTKLETYNKWV